MEPASVRLTNADFRKLIATPRHPATANSSSNLSNVNINELSALGQNALETPSLIVGEGGKTKKLASSERNDLRRKKKNFYAALKKQEDGKLQELSEKYRDRARERRDNINTDHQVVNTPNAQQPQPQQQTQPNNHTSSTSGYRAVAPDIKSGSEAAERRRRLIQESKFLGGDMEHTHLVKGLDYALLQKVRSELETKELEEQEAAEANEKLAEAAAAAEEQQQQQQQAASAADDMEDNMSIKSSLARNIYNIVQQRRTKEIQRNELFAAGRMAYVIDMDNEDDQQHIGGGDSDIPTTLIRSKYEVPVNHDNIATLTTNDIVINKLAQILTYLKAGGRNKRNKKRDKDKPLFYDNPTTATMSTSKPTSSSTTGEKRPTTAINARNDNIYDNVGEYQASYHKKNKASSSKPPASTYFGQQQQIIDNDDDCIPPPPKITKSLTTRLALMQNEQPEGYAECYPGLDEMNDAIDDSDDEVDYTKMDLGNKKGPIGRWDFDTQEEYSDYMSTKEALPKAAFQYGVKMQDGRKTRKNKIERNEKAELDREWQKIQNIIQKRKVPNSNKMTTSKNDED